MGTNYYFHEKPACPTCGHAPAPLHIGKSSGGWNFGLHVIPERGLNELSDWIRLWVKAPKGIIKNEYGEDIDIEDMIELIIDRHGSNGPLRAHEPDGSFCLGKGRDGTYDLILGYFS